MMVGGRGVSRRVLLSQMGYSLPDHVSFGLLGERAVMLDLKADRYYLVGGDETAALAALSGTSGEAPYRAIVHRLVDRGLIQSGNGAVAPIVAEDLQSSALEAADNSGALPIWETGVFRIGAGLSLRWRGLAATIARSRQLRDRYAARFRADM